MVTSKLFAHSTYMRRCVIPDLQAQLDSRNSLARTTLDCYLSTILAISECLHALGSDLAGPDQDQLVRLRQRLAFPPSAESLEESRETLRNTLLSFTARVRGQQDAQAAARIQLQTQLEKLRGFIEEMSEQNANAFVRLRDGIEDCAGRLEAPALKWPLDPSTGLAGRAEIEREINSRLEAERAFCVLFFSLEGVFGDEVPRQVGSALVANIRPRDFVGRWGGNEFVIVLECESPAAYSRAHHIAQWLSGQYRIAPDGPGAMVQVRLIPGIAERTMGDTVAGIMERAKGARSYAATAGD